MNSRLLLDDTTLRMSRVGFGVLADDIDTLDDHASLGGDDGQDLTGLALVVASVDIHCVTFLYM